MDWVASVFLSVVLSIPVGILANILSGRLERWLARRSATRAATLRANEEALSAGARLFLEHPDLFTHYLVARTLAVAGLGVLLIGILAVLVSSAVAAPFLANAVLGDRPVSAPFVLSIGFPIGLLALLSTMLVWRVMTRTIDMYQRVLRLRGDDFASVVTGI